MPRPRATPSFRELSAKEATAVLRRNHVGRIAFAFHRRVDILPIHYVYSAGWVYGRTSLGPKLLTLKHSQWVAFEVDEIDGLFDWRSVVLHGGLYLLDEDGPPREAAARRRAIRLLREFVPDTLSAADPVPFRDILFRVHVDELTGRAAQVR